MKFSASNLVVVIAFCLSLVSPGVIVAETGLDKNLNQDIRPANKQVPKVIQETNKVHAPAATSGGAEPESVTPANTRAPASLRHRDRSVTEGDYSNVTGKAPGVQVRRINMRADLETIKQRITFLRRTRDSLWKQASEPLPRGLSATEAAEAKRYVAWLKHTATKLEALAKKGDAMLHLAPKQSGNAMMEAQRQMQEMNRSFSMQYLAMQQKIQQETREFNLLSSIMKTKHEEAKKAINNIR